MDPSIPYLNRETANCWFGVNRTPGGGVSIPKSQSLPSGSLGASYSAITAPESTGLSGPVGLAIDSSDNIYVVNSLSATIEKIAPDGTATIFAATGFQPAFIAVQRSPKLVEHLHPGAGAHGDNVLDGGFIITGPWDN